MGGFEVHCLLGCNARDSETMVNVHRSYNPEDIQPFSFYRFNSLVILELLNVSTASEITIVTTLTVV